MKTQEQYFEDLARDSYNQYLEQLDEHETPKSFEGWREDAAQQAQEREFERNC